MASIFCFYSGAKAGLAFSISCLYGSSCPMCSFAERFFFSLLTLRSTTTLFSSSYFLRSSKDALSRLETDSFCYFLFCVCNTLSAAHAMETIGKVRTATETIGKV